MSTLLAAERLEVLILVDNVTDSYSSVPGFVTTEQRGLRQASMRRAVGAQLCCAIHGLSLILTVHGEGGTRSVLFDAGPAAEAVAHNGDRLAIDFAAIEAVVLSHGHWDHAGGLLAVFDRIATGRHSDGVPCYLHPGMFAERGTRERDGGVFPMDFIPTPETLAAHGAVPMVTTEPRYLLEGAFYLSGEIPRRTSYERGLARQVRRGPDGRWVPDPLVLDERFLAVNVRGKGLVVFSACSHAGIVNVLHAARETFPDERLHAVIGGFHLSGDNEAIIPETVRDLGGFGLDHIIPSHCTGWRALNALVAAYGERVVIPGSVGKRFTFAA